MSEKKKWGRMITIELNNKQWMKWKLNTKEKPSGTDYNLNTKRFLLHYFKSCVFCIYLLYNKLNKCVLNLNIM